MTKDKSAPREVELKLDIEPGDLGRILAHPILRGTSGDNPDPRSLQSIYFDTPDHALKQAGISLRIRRNGDKRIQTIKADQSSGSLALSRNEWEQEVSRDVPDFSEPAETALKPFLERRETIQPVFGLSVQRIIRHVSYGNSRIEVAVDQGRVERDNPSQAFAQLELELKEGNPADLFGLALALADAAPLHLSFRTKAEHGYAAISEKAPTRVKAGAIALKRKMTGAAAFQVIAASCLQHLAANEAIVRVTPEADAVHQMRVALRRLRAAVTLFKTVVSDGRLNWIKAELKWMASQLGEARDLDVYIANVLEPALVRHAGDPGYRELKAEYEQRRELAYAKAREAIASDRFTRGVLETACWIEAGDWLKDESKAANARRSQPVKTLAKDQLKRRWKRILKRGKHLAELEPEERHRVRIEIKKLRYAAEFFESLFKGKGAKKRKQSALNILEALQETLGELNDIAVGSSMSTSPAAEAIHQDQIARGGGLLDAAKAQYRELRALEPFWKS